MELFAKAADWGDHRKATPVQDLESLRKLAMLEGEPIEFTVASSLVRRWKIAKRLKDGDEYRISVHPSKLDFWREWLAKTGEPAVLDSCDHIAEEKAVLWTLS